MLYFQKDLETMSRDQITHIQTQRLQSIVKYAYEKNAVYRKLMESKGIEPGDIKSLDDLPLLPFIDKELLRKCYPLKLSCVDEKSIREIHMSSGSTGTPVVNAYTENDLQQWAECMARCYAMAGLDVGEKIQITPSFGLFNGGFGFYHGARKRGLFVVPTSAGHTSRQVRLMNEFKVEGFGAVVSYALRVIEYMEAKGISELPHLRVGIFGAESFSDSMREKVENGLGIEAFDIYGMTETGGVGTTGMDCPDHSGIHVWEDHYILEIIDPATGEVLPDGEEGEVVFTSLTRETIPVIRLRTKDISKVLSREKCACGRTHVRIDRIKGRLDDMIIVKGVNFYPRQVEQALMEIPGVRNHYQIIIEESDGIKDVRINVEVEEGVTGFTVERHLKEVLGFSPKGDVFAPGQLKRMEGKQQRVFYDDPNK